MAEEELGERLELVVFQARELYIYKVPPASSIGHRAETWDVDKWLQEVSMKVVTRGDECRIKLYDMKTGAFFAECPVPHPDVAPLQTAVDPVVDSSRYFVLRLLDSKTGRHAFIGIGFRERSQASDFNAAIAEHLQYIRRAREAEQMRESFAAASGGDVGDAPSSSKAQADLSLKPGTTLTINLGGKARGPSRLNQAQSTALSEPPSTSGAGLLPKLPPPPGSEQAGNFKLQANDLPAALSMALSFRKGVPQTAENGASRQDDWGDFVS